MIEWTKMRTTTWTLLLVGALSAASTVEQVRAAGSMADVVQQVQPRMVKIYGAGGVRGLESYQSGLLLSAEGHILTVWSYVLDTDEIRVTLDDGRRFTAELVGADPVRELAVLKIDAEELPHFSLKSGATASAGTRVLAFSNLFGVATGNEQASVMRGVVAATTRLDARRGVYKTPYTGPAYVLDAVTNNPGAAGGALTDRRGRLLGLLGKELRSSQNDTWLNYALPIEHVREPVEAILTGKQRPDAKRSARRRPKAPHSLSGIGIVLVPDVLQRTPPYVDEVRADSPAAKAGLRRDDLILYVGDTLLRTCKTVQEEFGFLDRADEVRVTVMRDQQLIQINLPASKGK